MTSSTTPVPLRSPATAAPRARPARPIVLGVLVSRLVLFGAVQAGLALLFALRGHAAPWAASVPWWPLTATLVNVFGVVLLALLLRREGTSLRALYRIERGSAGRDLLLALGLLVVGAALAMGPNLGLATLLWGDPEASLALFVQPLPVWAAWVTLVGFPLTIALSELPTYYGWVRPRLEEAGARAWQAVVLAGLFHGLQHATLPLVFDARFVIWRALMFLPFALFVGAALRRRPRLLPYLMIAHGMLDASVGLMVWQASLA